MKPPFPDSLHCPSVYLNFFFFLSSSSLCFIDAQLIRQQEYWTARTCHLRLVLSPCLSEQQQVKKKKRGEKTAYVRQLTQRQYRMALQHRPDFFFFIKTTKNEKLSKNSLVQISVHIHICMYKQPNTHTHTQKKKMRLHRFLRTLPRIRKAREKKKGTVSSKKSNGSSIKTEKHKKTEKNLL